MWFRSLFDALLIISANNCVRGNRSRQVIRAHFSSRRMRPCLEVLEDRTVPTIFNVGPGDVATLIKDIATADLNGESRNVINLTKSTYDLTGINNYWYGPNGLPPIYSNLTIHGNGAVIQRDSGANTPDFRLFYVSGGMEIAAGSLTMDNVTLEGGIAKGGDSGTGGGGMGAGGAIFNQGTLNLTDVTLTNNEALGGSSGVVNSASGGGGLGGNADNSGDGGGFGGNFVSTVGGSGGSGSNGGGRGGGGGFVNGDNGGNGTATGQGGNGGGRGAFGGNGYSNAAAGLGGDGGGGSFGGNGFGGGSGGNFGNGGGNGVGGAGGGGGVGGGGARGGGGGFGGGGGVGGGGGFGGGGGGEGYAGGFGGGNGTVGGNGGGGAGLGGAIFNMGADSVHPRSGQVTLINCTLTANFAYGGNGGGGNNAGTGGEGFGGAFFNLDGTITLTNDTLASNYVAGGIGSGTSIAHGGAVYNLAFGHDIDTGNAVRASLLLNNSILANSILASSININGNPVAADDLDSETSAIVNGSNNLVMSSNGNVPSSVIKLADNPSLGPLQYNGGLTPTMLPGVGSPVLGAGNPSLAPSTDQRDQPRPPDGPTDLGSIQVSVSLTTGGSTNGSSPGSTPTSAGFLGLAIEEFELTIDTILGLVEGIVDQPDATLDATIAQLQSAINNDPLTPTPTGQLAIMLGQSLALRALGGG